MNVTPEEARRVRMCSVKTAVRRDVRNTEECPPYPPPQCAACLQNCIYVTIIHHIYHTCVFLSLFLSHSTAHPCEKENEDTKADNANTDRLPGATVFKGLFFSRVAFGSTRLYLRLDLSTAWLYVRRLTLTGELELRLSRSPLQQMSSQICSYASFPLLSSMLLSHNLSLLHFSLLFSSASQRLSFTALGIFLPLNFDSSPVSALSSHPFFGKSFPLFSLYLCVSLMLSSLDVSFRLSLDSSHTIYCWVWSRYTFSPSSVFLCFTHTQSDCLSPRGLPVDQSRHVSVSRRVTELLDS